MSLAPPSPIAITYGDPAGIGPDLVLTLPDTFADAPLVVIGDRQVLSERAQQLGLTVPLGDWQPGQPPAGLASPRRRQRHRWPAESGHRHHHTHHAHPRRPGLP